MSRRADPGFTTDDLARVSDGEWPGDSGDHPMRRADGRWTGEAYVFAALVPELGIRLGREGAPLFEGAVQRLVPHLPALWRDVQAGRPRPVHLVLKDEALVPGVSVTIVLDALTRAVAWLKADGGPAIDDSMARLLDTVKRCRAQGTYDVIAKFVPPYRTAATLPKK